MIIHLPSVPDEGKQFEFSNKDIELARDLGDLIGQEELKLEFYLRPLGEAYEIKGSLTTKAPLDCSFCGENYPYSISKNILDILVPSRSKPNAKPVDKQQLDPEQNANWREEQAPGVHGEKFHVLEYLREHVGFEIPFQVPCKASLESCPNYNETQKALKKYDSDEIKPDSPFAALKTLQIDKKH